MNNRVNNLPVKANDKHFYNANGLDVVNADASAFTDLACSNITLAGNYIKPFSSLNVTNTQGNTWLPVMASDFIINGQYKISDHISPVNSALSFVSGLTVENAYCVKIGHVAMLSVAVTSSGFTCDNNVLLGYVGTETTPTYRADTIGMTWQSGVGAHTIELVLNPNRAITMLVSGRHTCERIAFNMVFLSN